MWNLLRLSRITADPTLADKAADLGRAFSGQVQPSPVAYTQLLVALDFAVGPSYEVVISGSAHGEDTMAMVAALRAQFVPNKVVLFRPDGREATGITALAEFTRYQKSIGGRATAYVCLDHNCQLPTTEIDTMLELLGVGLR